MYAADVDILCPQSQYRVLAGIAEGLERSLFDALPRGTTVGDVSKAERGTQKAQHSKHFDISPEELNWLRERIQVLGQKVQEICITHIAKLKQAAEV
jgi:hypothetical protein